MLLTIKNDVLSEPVKDGQADGILDSLPIDLAAKNGDASFIIKQ
jgi:ATP-dependent DNA helicase